MVAAPSGAQRAFVNLASRLDLTVKVAYLIRAHHAPSLLERLVRRISGPEAGVFIHVSRTAEDTVYDEMVSRLQDVDGVAWLPRRTCRYGGFSLVEATLSGSKHPGGRPPPGLTRSCSRARTIRLRSPCEIEGFLEARRGRASSTTSGSRRGVAREGGGLDRVRYPYFERIR